MESHPDMSPLIEKPKIKLEFDLFSFYITFNSQGKIATGSLRVEESVHTNWSGFCTVNHRASASNYQLSNMKCQGHDLNRRLQRFIYIKFKSEKNIYILCYVEVEIF